MLTFTSAPAWIVLAPPVVTIIVALVTRKAILSLLIGVILSAIIHSGALNLSTLERIISYGISVFYQKDQFRLDNIYVMIFLWLLGALIALLMNSGSMEIIANKLNEAITSRLKAQIVVFVLGLILFIDDFFNSLALGAISRPLTDKKGISREKLAYFLDATSAPVCILMPISSWGAVIIGIMDNEVSHLGIKYFDGLGLFMSSLFYNYYPLIALSLVPISILSRKDFPLMAKYEKQARQANREYNANHTVITPSKKLERAATMQVIGSVFILTFVTIASMLISGYLSCEPGHITLLHILGNMKIGMSLMIGGITSIAAALILKPASKSSVVRSFKEGLESMAPAMQILFFAWALSAGIHDLQIGQYISEVIITSQISTKLLPLSIFLIASAMAFSTGTSWVTFSVLIPVVCQLTLPHGPEIMSICIGAVLSGSVFGDHASPISGTTILSSTGAGCSLMSHALTQMPYCILGAALSAVAFFIAGI